METLEADPSSSGHGLNCSDINAKDKSLTCHCDQDQMLVTEPGGSNLAADGHEVNL